MKFEKGRQKTGGRKKDTSNKVTQPLRELITAFLEDNFDEVTRIWQGMKPGRDKLNFYRDMVRYAVPQLQSTELKTDFDALTDEQLDHIIDGLTKKYYEQISKD